MNDKLSGNGRLLDSSISRWQTSFAGYLRTRKTDESSIRKGVRKMSEEKTTPAASGKQAAKMLGFGGFFAMTASMVMTVYAYPNFASSGLHLIFFLILGGIFWFLPVALVAAEMATVKGMGRRWHLCLGRQHPRQALGFRGPVLPMVPDHGRLRDHGVLRPGRDFVHRGMGRTLQ